MNERTITVCLYLISHRYAKNLTTIAVNCGKSKQYFSDLKANRQNVSNDFIDKLCTIYPQANKAYILLNEGKPLVKKPQKTPNTDIEQQQYLQIIHSQQETINRLSTLLDTLLRNRK